MEEPKIVKLSARSLVSVADLLASAMQAGNTAEEQPKEDTDEKC